MTSRLGASGPGGGAVDGARAGGAEDSARTGGADEGTFGEGGAGRVGVVDALGVTATGGTDGTSPALRRRCIADSKASFRVAGVGGIARQLAMRLRRRRASTSRARARAEDSPCVRIAMVWSSAPSATFQEAELRRGTIGAD